MAPELQKQRSIIEDENDPENAGQPSMRSCTDICCLTIFVTFLCGMGHIWMESQDNGNIEKLTSGFDWRGHICGVDPDVIHKPNMYWCAKSDPSLGSAGLTLTDGICVEECPTSTSTQHYCPDAPEFFANTPSPDDDSETQDVTLGVTRSLVLRDSYKTMKLQGLGYCFPDPSSPQYAHIMTLIANQTELGQQGQSALTMAHGVSQSWRFLIAMVFFGVFLGYAFLFLLKTFIKPFILTLMFTLVALVLGLGGFVLYSAWNPEYNMFAHLTNDVDQAKLYAQIAGAVILVLACPVICLIMSAKRAIEVTVECVQESCSLVVHLPTLLLQPLTQIVLKTVLLLVLLYGLLWAISMGEVRPSTSIDPLNPDGWADMAASGLSRGIVLTKPQKIMILYWIFGIFWILEVVTASGNFALSHSVVLYKVHGRTHWMPLFRGYFNAFTFHLGTLAFGAFIIGVLKIITIVVSYIARQTKNPDGSENKVAKCCACCCVALLTCVTRLMEYINEMVYTECCIHGNGYLLSSKAAMTRLISNPVVFATVKGTTSIVKVLGVGIITIGGTWLVYKVQVDGWSADIQAAAQRAAEAAGNATGVDVSIVAGDMMDVMATRQALGVTVASAFIFLYISECFMDVFDHTANSLAYTILWLQETPEGKLAHPDPPSWSEAQKHHSEDSEPAPYTELG